MGKATRWFRGLLGLKKTDLTTESPTPITPKDKRRWSFVKSSREKDRNPHHNHNYHDHHHHDGSVKTTDQLTQPSFVNDVDPDKHAIAVAAATAAVAEAAVAAAQAAAAVVRLTSSGRSVNATASLSDGSVAVREGWAAVKIQAAFRGCLARKALRALKGLVRLQALVRGHIERKRTAEWLNRMQSLLRAQIRAQAGRSHTPEISHSSSNSNKSSHFHPIGPTTPEKFEHKVLTTSMKMDQSLMLRRFGSRLKEGIQVNHQSLNQQQGSSSISTGTRDEEWSDKLEIDRGKSQHHLIRNKINSFTTTTTTTSKDSLTYQTVPSSSCELQSISSVKVYGEDEEESSFCTADNSPQFYSANSRGGNSNAKRSPFSTPTKSDRFRNCFNGYPDYPSYMACTESSRAKLRSLSAPRQRPHFERSGSAKRGSVHCSGELRLSAQKVSALHSNLMSKAYPGSGRLDKLGMPVGYGL